MHTKTVILLENFSFGLNNCVYSSSTIFIQRFLTFLIIFIKNGFLTFFILGVNVCYIYDFQRHDYSQQDLVANRALHSFKKQYRKVLCSLFLLFAMVSTDGVDYTSHELMHLSDCHTNA